MPTFLYWVAMAPLILIAVVFVIAFVASIVDDVKAKGWVNGLMPVWMILIALAFVWGLHGLLA